VFVQHSGLYLKWVCRSELDCCNTTNKHVYFSADKDRFNCVDLFEMAVRRDNSHTELLISLIKKDKKFATMTQIWSHVIHYDIIHYCTLFQLVKHLETNTTILLRELLGILNVLKDPWTTCEVTEKFGLSKWIFMYITDLLCCVYLGFQDWYKHTYCKANYQIQFKIQHSEHNKHHFRGQRKHL
jgi:hypothetical protein